MSELKAVLKDLRARLLYPITKDIDALRLAVGHIECSRVVERDKSYTNLKDVEFRVFSQWGDDGIIQYLVSRVPTIRKEFVEFGVGDYRESNTRFLLENDGWRGLILDGGTQHIRFIRTNPIGWRHAIEARSVMLTAENINQELLNAGFSGEIGLLSIDVDGNDYWILKAIEVVKPGILIVEYNSIFGPDLEVTVPYDPSFSRTSKHHSNLYFGASIAALCSAARDKGYALVGSNSAGVNAYFVRLDLVGDLTVRSASECWVESSFRESRNERGELTFVDSHRDRLRLIADELLIDVKSERSAKIRDLF